MFSLRPLFSGSDFSQGPYSQHPAPYLAVFHNLAALLGWPSLECFSATKSWYTPYLCGFLTDHWFSTYHGPRCRTVEHYRPCCYTSHVMKPPEFDRCTKNMIPIHSTLHQLHINCNHNLFIFIYYFIFFTI